MRNTARAIDQHLKSCRTVSPNAVRVVLMDAHNCYAFTEADLDAWWANHAAAEKAQIFEMYMGDAEESCQFCGCTQNRACSGGCSWLDPNHTVCSAPACAEKWSATLTALVLEAAHATF